VEIPCDLFDGDAFVDPTEIKNADGFVQSDVDIIDGCWEKSLTKLFYVLLFDFTVDEVLEHGLMLFL
jgi:hypothetical protein